jgi:NitT/TauT family transport system ATP-binding protein
LKVCKEKFLMKNVCKSFNSKEIVLANISLTIDKGEFVSVVGPSGCGKSTILRLLAGLCKPSAGKITFPLFPTPIEIGYVFQDPTLLPWATVYENVALPYRIKNSLNAYHKKEISQMLEMVGLTNHQNYFPRELSGGMRMRVSIARALAQRPNLLLLDEPFAALDEFTREQLNLDLLRLWSEQEWTGVFVTHSISEAAFISDRVIVISPIPGKILADLEIPFARPRKLNLKHQHSFTDFCAQISKTLHPRTRSKP